MAKTKVKHDRLSIDIDHEEHIKIKMFAAVNGKTIREFVLESIRERVQKAKETGDLKAMTIEPSKALWDLWDNKKDAAYDDI